MKLVVSGAGAAALSCLGLLEKLGLPRENMWVTDIEGVVWKGRNELMDPWKERYARDTAGAHAGRCHPRCRRFPRPVGRRRAEAGTARQHMAPKPLILALANPNPGDHA